MNLDLYLLKIAVLVLMIVLYHSKIFRFHVYQKTVIHIQKHQRHRNSDRYNYKDVITRYDHNKNFGYLNSFFCGLFMLIFFHAAINYFYHIKCLLHFIQMCLYPPVCMGPKYQTL